MSFPLFFLRQVSFCAFGAVKAPALAANPTKRELEMFTFLLHRFRRWGKTLRNLLLWLPLWLLYPTNIAKVLYCFGMFWAYASYFIICDKVGDTVEEIPKNL